MAAHAAQPNSPTAQQPNSPTAHYYSAVTTAKSAFNVKPASLLAAPRHRSAARRLLPCVRLAAFAAAILFFFLAWPFAAPAFAAAAPVAAPHAAPPARLPPTPLSEFSLHCPLKFITGICTDGPHRIWVSGEDHGLYAGKIEYRHLYLPSHRGAAAAASAVHSLILSSHDLHIHWYHFDKANSPGLASNFITAIAVDGKGRLWAGTDRHGVCVFNGRHWKHYSILNGPLGCHVYAIAFNQAADQVWIATENGLSIYQCGHDAGAVRVRAGRFIRPEVHMPFPAIPRAPGIT